MYVFNRSISVNVRTKDLKIVTVDGVFLDSLHELCLTIEVDLENYIITSADGELRRAPHSDCRHTQQLICNLVGVDLSRNVRKQIQAAVGFSDGCTHLTDLTIECVKAVLQAKFQLMHHTMQEEQIKGQLEQYLKGTCLHYNKT